MEYADGDVGTVTASNLIHIVSTLCVCVCECLCVCSKINYAVLTVVCCQKSSSICLILSCSLAGR